MSELLFSITSEDFLQGLSPDIPHGPPVWHTGHNVLFTDRGVQPIGGQFNIVGAEDIDEHITGLLMTEIAGSGELFIGTPTRILKWDGSSLSTVGSGYTGTIDAHWSMAPWGDWVLATNGVDTPQVYKGTSFAALTGITFDTAKLFVTHPTNSFVLAFATSGGTEGGFGRIHWCDKDDVETWTAALTNFAGFITLRNIDSEIVAAIAAGGQIYAFTSDGMFRVPFVGHPFAFEQSKLADGVGAIGPQTVGTAENTIYGFGPRGLWATDLVGNYRYFDIPLVREELFSKLDATLQHRSVVWHDRAEHVVVVFFPVKDSGQEGPARGLGFNYVDRNWNILNFGRTAVADTGAFPYAVAADELGNVYYQAAAGQIPGIAPLPGNTAPGVLPIVESKTYRGAFGHGPFGEWEFGGPGE